MKERVPDGEQIAPARIEAADIVLVLQILPAHQLVMDQSRERRENNPQPLFMGLQAEVESLLMTECASSKPPSFSNTSAAHQHAGAGHRDDVALRQRKAKIAGSSSLQKRKACRAIPLPARNIPAC